MLPLRTGHLTQHLQVDFERKYGCYHGKLTNGQAEERLAGKGIGAWLVHADEKNCNQLHVQFMMENLEQATVTLVKDLHAPDSNKAFKMVDHSFNLEDWAQQNATKVSRMKKTNASVAWFVRTSMLKSLLNAHLAVTPSEMHISPVQAQ